MLIEASLKYIVKDTTENNTLQHYLLQRKIIAIDDFNFIGAGEGLIYDIMSFKRIHSEKFFWPVEDAACPIYIPFPPA